MTSTNDHPIIVNMKWSRCLECTQGEVAVAPQIPCEGLHETIAAWNPCDIIQKAQDRDEYTKYEEENN